MIKRFTLEDEITCAICWENACFCVTEYEDFMYERPNVTDDEVEARFGLPAEELHRMYTEWQVTSGQNYASGNYIKTK